MICQLIKQAPNNIEIASYKLPESSKYLAVVLSDN